MGSLLWAAEKIAKGRSQLASGREVPWNPLLVLDTAFSLSGGQRSDCAFDWRAKYVPAWVQAVVVRCDGISGEG